ncbi:Ankyrin repeat protein 1 [Giardia muris]|uniref:Ankyrin repeat protein 1 n=1 Tax=Giardia muris TaxID=5742 RepID=A0A4Z1SVH2_GIAMU|nr:Ankyrin repeat protein 1 [Giardia muris]|eukprot:TNJ29796.1 Ankyrin repeat protein 1 [Giardia muris]
MPIVAFIRTQMAVASDEDPGYIRMLVETAKRLSSSFIIRPLALLRSGSSLMINYDMPRNATSLAEVIAERSLYCEQFPEELLRRTFFCLIQATEALERAKTPFPTFAVPEAIFILPTGFLQVSLPHIIARGGQQSLTSSMQLQAICMFIRQLIKFNTNRLHAMGQSDSPLPRLTKQIRSSSKKKHASPTLQRVSSRTHLQISLLNPSEQDTTESCAVRPRRSLSRPVRTSLKGSLLSSSSSTSIGLKVDLPKQTDLAQTQGTSLEGILAVLQLETFEKDLSIETLLGISRVQRWFGDLCISMYKGLKGIHFPSTALIDAVKSRNHEQLGLLLHLVGHTDDRGMTALMWAAATNNKHAVYLLNEYEAGYIDMQGCSATCHAIIAGNKECFLMLKEVESHIHEGCGLTPLIFGLCLTPHNCDSKQLVHASTVLKSGHTPLMVAAIYNSTSWLVPLLRAAPHMAEQSLKGDITALMLAVESGALSMARALIHHTPHMIGKVDTMGRTALMRLMLLPAPELPQSPGAPPSPEPPKTRAELMSGFPLHDVLQEDFLFVLERLAPSESSISENDGMFAIDLALKTRNVEVIQHISRYSYNEVKDPETGMTRLMHACIEGDFALVCALYSAEAGLVDINGRTALMHIALRNETPEGLRCLELLARLEASRRDNNGRTALMYACIMQNFGQVMVLHQFESGLLDHEGKNEIDISKTIPNNTEIYNYLSARLPMVRLEHDRTPLMQSILEKKTASLERNQLTMMLHSQKKLRDDRGRTALMYCVEYGNLDVFERLRDVELYSRTFENTTTLMECAKQPLTSENAETLIPMVKRLLCESQMTDRDGNTALIYAVRAGSAKLIRILASREAGIQNHYGDTALLLALRNSRLNFCVQHLFERERGIRTLSGLSPFMVACQVGNEAVAQQLFDPSLLGELDETGNTALIHASHHCMDRVIPYLIDAECGTVSRNQQCPTALLAYIMAHGQNTEIIQKLCAKEGTIPSVYGTPFQLALKHRCIAALSALQDVIKETFDWKTGNTPLMDAVVARDLSAIRLLEPCLATVKNKKSGKTALILAIETGNFDACALLREREARIVCPDGRSPLMLAIDLHQIDIAELLVGVGSGISTEKGGFALRSALLEGYPGLAQKLITTELNLMRQSGLTPLMIASALGLTDTALHYADAYAGEAGPDGITALMYAVMSRNKAIVSHLASKEMHLQDALGRTALIFTAKHNYPEGTRLVLQEATAQMKKGWTALMWAATRGATECVVLLRSLESGIRNDRDETALMLAAQAGHPDAVRALCPYEGGLHITSGKSLNKGFTALHFAALSGNADCVEALLASEAGLETAEHPAEYWAHRNGNTRCAQMIEEYLAGRSD